MGHELVICFFGICTGFLSGLLGIGGAILLAPLLILAFPLVTGEALSMLAITGLCVAQSFFGSLSAIFHFRKNSEWNVSLVKRFGLPMAMATLILSFNATSIPDRAVLLILGGLGITSVLITLFPESFFRTRVKVSIKEGWALPFIGITIGVLCGSIGHGGGFIYLPIMICVLAVPIRMAICTAPIIGLLSSSGLLIGRGFSDTMDWHLCLFLLLGIFAGSKIGAIVSLKLNESKLKKAVNGFVLVSAVKMMSLAL